MLWKDSSERRSPQENLDKTPDERGEDMGRKDFRKHETKKPKKEARKAITTQAPVITTPMVVEVVRKHRKEKEEEVPEE